MFLNNKKIRTIVPLFNESRFITDFTKKSEVYIFFFCTMLPYNSSLPADVNYIVDKRLSTVTFSAKDIRNIIQNLNSNKAHGHDNISIRMLRICSNTVRYDLCTVRYDF